MSCILLYYELGAKKDNILYGGFEFSTRYCTFVVNKHFLITCYVCLLFCSCGNVTELTLVYIYC